MTTPPVQTPSWMDLGYFEESQYAAMRGIDVRALRNERAAGKGPPFARIGRRTLYPVKSTLKHIEASVVVPTARPTLINGA